MRTIQLNLNRGQFVSIIRTLDDSDKLMIYRELKKELFLKRFEGLLKSLRTDELSLEDITKEVETVRQRRYEKGKQNL